MLIFIKFYIAQFVLVQIFFLISRIFYLHPFFFLYQAQPSRAVSSQIHGSTPASALQNRTVTLSDPAAVQAAIAAVRNDADPCNWCVG